MSSGTKSDQFEWVDYLLFPSLLMVVLTFSTGLVELNNGLDFDGVFYFSMVTRSPGDELLYLRAPWCWRVLGPSLAFYLPFDPFLNLKVLGLVSLWLSQVLVLLVLKEAGFQRWQRLLGLLLYVGVYWAAKGLIFSPAYQDALAQVFVLLVLYSCYRGWYRLLPVLFLAGVMQRESLLLLTPMVYVFRGDFGRNGKLYLVLLLVFGLVGIGFVRFFVEPVNSYSPEAALRFVFLDHLLSFRLWPGFFLAAIVGTGMLLPFILVNLRRVVKRVAAEPFWLVYLVAGVVTLFGGIDKARLFLFSLPAFVVLALEALGPLLREGTPLLRSWLSFWILVHIGLGYHLVPPHLQNTYFYLMHPEHIEPTDYSLLIAAVVSLLAFFVSARLVGARPS